MGGDGGGEGRRHLNSCLPEDLLAAQGAGHADHRVLRGEVAGGEGGSSGGGRGGGVTGVVGVVMVVTRVVGRAPDKFNLFKPYLKTIQILANNFWLKNAQTYNNLFLPFCLCLGVCLCVYFFVCLCLYVCIFLPLHLHFLFVQIALHGVLPASEIF